MKRTNLFLEKLNAIELGRFMKLYRKFSEGEDVDYIGLNHVNKHISDKLDQPLHLEIICIDDAPQVLVRPDYSGPSTVPSHQRDEITSLLLPFVIPIEGTYVDVTEDLAEQVMITGSYE